MKLLTRVVAVAFLAACVSGCTPKTPAIGVASGDFDLNPLVGEWRGTYSSTQTGRSGTIAFTLRAGESAAFGRVIMIPRTADSLFTPNTNPTGGTTISTAAERQSLTINFVRKQGGTLLGTLDPYMDPDCRCTVNTNFQGAFTDARTIEGTFTTTNPQGATPPTAGTWKVTRLRKL